MTQVALLRPTFDAFTAGAMLLLVVGVSAVWLAVIYRVSPRACAWFAFTLVMVLVGNAAGDYLGLFSRLDLLPSPFVVWVLICLVLVIAFAMGYLGDTGDELVRNLNVETLIALQIFRFPLELVMLRAATLGIMPVEFSMSGYNFDVVTGIGALVLLTFCVRTGHLPLGLIWIWNALGICCLIAICVLAVLTSPNLHAFGESAQHINSWVLYFPYSLLPTVLVSYAVLGQVLLTRKLLRLKGLPVRAGISAKRI